MSSSLAITFCGAAGRVTGSNFLLEAGDGTKLLVDCGLVQGGRIFEETNRAPFPYQPKEIAAIFVTHAHLDHVGRIPKLVHDGFNGRIISTPPTKEIAELVLLDSMGVMEKEAEHKKEQLLYTASDVAHTMTLWETVEYGGIVRVGSLDICLMNAGHILGSAMIVVVYKGSKLVFTGDLGNSPTPLLPDTDALYDANYLVMESVYGDRNHEAREERETILEDMIEETVKRGGALLIPAFSVERTQELLFELNDMVEHGRIPRVPVYLDSPLAISVTALYKKYDRYFNDNARGLIRSGDDVLNFHGLISTKTTEESRAIHEILGPKIIIAGSGMSNGGRIVHHEKRYLGDPTTTLLLIGYQVAGSLGRQLESGARQVKILGEPIEVRAKIVQISGYSAHKDSDHLLDFVRGSAETLRQVYCVHGEPKSAFALVQRIRDNLGILASAPREGDKATLEF